MESASTLQYVNPKHFNAYYGYGIANNTNNENASSSSSAIRIASSFTTSVPNHRAPSSMKNNNNNNTESSQSVQLLRRDELTIKLSQYTRQNDRRQMLRALSDTKLFPRMHGPLSSVCGVEDIAMAEREAAGERAILNGVKFLQVSTKKNSSSSQSSSSSLPPTPLDSNFLQTLREVCGHMCEMDDVDADPMALYGGLLLRLCRSASEHDALAMLTNYLCGSSKGGELILLPLKKRHHYNNNNIIMSNGTSSTTSSSSVTLLPGSMAAPLELELYVESNNVHAKVTMKHELGLFKRSDLETAGLKKELSPWNALVIFIQQRMQQQQQQMTARHVVSSSEMKQLGQIQYSVVSSAKFNKIRPWAYIDAEIVERINFGTGGSVRMLHVRVPEDKNSGYVKK